MNRVFLLLVCAMPLCADPLSDLLARLDRSSQQFRSMTANIRDTEHTAVVNDDTTMNGTIAVRRAKAGDTRMLIVFTGNEAKTIAIEGKEVRVLYPKINTVQVWDVGEKRGLIDQFLLLGFGASGDELKAAYDITWVGNERLGSESADHIRLVPKSKEILKQLKQAELWISPTSGMPLQQKFLTSGGGDYKLVAYSNMRLNPTLTDKDLKLNPPKGAVIQQMK